MLKFQSNRTIVNKIEDSESADRIAVIHHFTVADYVLYDGKECLATSAASRNGSYTELIEFCAEDLYNSPDGSGKVTEVIV